MDDDTCEPNEMDDPTRSLDKEFDAVDDDIGNIGNSDDATERSTMELDDDHDGSRVTISGGIVSDEQYQEDDEVPDYPRYDASWINTVTDIFSIASGTTSVAETRNGYFEEHIVERAEGEREKKKKKSPGFAKISRAVIQASLAQTPDNTARELCLFAEMLIARHTNKSWEDDKRKYDPCDHFGLFMTREYFTNTYTLAATVTLELLRVALGSCSRSSMLSKTIFNLEMFPHL
ncbi:hypothetical protein GQ600_1877 [Phytophthora cactorum]|nr:hypothetical protein GQ600_1877 [Phytophthora cactorum]